MGRGKVAGSSTLRRGVAIFANELVRLREHRQDEMMAEEVHFHSPLQKSGAPTPTAASAVSPQSVPDSNEIQENQAT